jgi:hypothetical protein
MVCRIGLELLLEYTARGHHQVRCETAGAWATTLPKKSSCKSQKFFMENAPLVSENPSRKPNGIDQNQA